MIFDFSLAQIASDLILWLVVASAEGLLFTLFYKRILGEYWWNIKPPSKDAYGFSLDANGWSFHAKEFNPLETFRKMADDFSGKNKPMKEIVKETVHNTIKNQIRHSVAEVLSTEEVAKTMGEMIKESMMEEFKDVFKEQKDEKKK